MTRELGARIFHRVEHKIGDEWVDFGHGGMAKRSP
jgi:hypothetical protein